MPLPKPNLHRNFQSTSHQTPQEWNPILSSYLEDIPEAGTSDGEEDIDAASRLINLFNFRNVQREARSINAANMYVLVPTRKYSVTEITEVGTTHGRQQIWSLVDKSENSFRKIWAPTALAETVRARDEAGVDYLAMKKCRIVIKRIIIHYLGYRGPLTAPSYKFNLCIKKSK